ncbi:unnamed protein product [Allacma fusca]|uniref:Peptidase S1 domain-containing protein n=1 Tax=Allacma fusca TaxID=39272 RepID=A0A8J2P2N1_9HEXA|nr:unnamed protein product [Allacma fusca]
MKFSYVGFLLIVNIWTLSINSWKIDTKAEFEKFSNTTLKKSSRNRIVGGYAAKPNSHPSILSMRRNSFHICGGTIIGPEWVVSAAHCHSNEYKVTSYSFAAAEHRMDQMEDEQYVYATKVVPHPDYNSKSKWNDIVLFQVDPPFVFGEKVQPVTLPGTGYVPQGKIIVTGWGLTAEDGDIANELQEVEVDNIDLGKCDEWYKKLVITEKQICAGFEEGGKDSCQGDSGGPLYDVIDGKHVLLGVVSFGRGCARPQHPGVYTRVSEYQDWILNVTTAIGNESGNGTLPKTSKKSGNGKSGKRSFSKIEQVGYEASVLEHICGQKDLFDKTGEIPSPVRERPFSNIPGGIFTWDTCDLDRCAKLIKTG